MATTFQVNQEIFYIGKYGPQKSTIVRTYTDHANNIDRYNVDNEPLDKFFNEDELSTDESGIIDIFEDKVGDL